MSRRTDEKLDALVALVARAVDPERSTQGVTIGIDPGTKYLGLAAVDHRVKPAKLLEMKQVRIEGEMKIAKLAQIYFATGDFLSQFKNDITRVAVERGFVWKGAMTAVIIGEARGAALVALHGYLITVEEVSNSTWKKIVVGKGNATKLDVQRYIAKRFKMKKFPPQDAADAASLALFAGRTN